MQVAALYRTICYYHIFSSGYILSKIYISFYPFLIYPLAWSGHYFFEKNKPAAFTNPLYAKISDWLMFKDILLGRIKIW